MNSQNISPEQTKPLEPETYANGNESRQIENVKIQVTGLGHVPSFKNCKIAVKDNNRPGKQKNITDPKVKDRMMRFENAIVYELYSDSQIEGSETHSECLKRLRTFLSGLLDDSIREIPCGEWSTEYVPIGQEGIQILIERI